MIKEQKFTEIFRQYSDTVWKSAFRRTGKRTVAEEITQQVFLHYFEKMESMDDEYIYPWLCLTAKNVTYDYFRKARVRSMECSLGDIEEKVFSESDNTVRMIERLASRGLLNEILEELYQHKPEWYEVIEASCIREMSANEAAAYLGITNEAFRGRLCRARSYVRKQYGEAFAELKG